MPGVLIIGIGNDYRRDDSAGLRAVRAMEPLIQLGSEEARVVEASGDGTALLDLWSKEQSVILVDAVSSGQAPGTITRYNLRKETLPAVFFRGSTHALGVAEAVGLARAFNSMPDRMIFLGIEGKEFGAGTELSAEIDKALPSLVQSILDEIRKPRTIEHA